MSQFKFRPSLESLDDRIVPDAGPNVPIDAIVNNEPQSAPPRGTSDDALNQRLFLLNVQLGAQEALLAFADLRLAVADAGVVSAGRAAAAGIDPDALRKFDLAMKIQYEIQLEIARIKDSIKEIIYLKSLIEDLQMRRQQGGPGRDSDAVQI